MKRQLPDRVKMAALLLPTVGDTAVPWVLDACSKFVDPFTKRVTLARGWHLVTCDIEPLTGEVVRVDLNARLPWETGQFEAVLCVDTLEHVDRTDNALAEIARITRRDGLLIFGVPMPGQFPDLRATTHRLNPGDEEHGHVWAFGVDVINRVLATGYRHIGGVYSHDDEIMRLSHLWIFERR